MKKVILSFLTLAGIALANSASAIPVTLILHNQQSGATISTLVWRNCGTGPYSVGSGCVNPTNTWDSANGVVGTSPTWDWNPATGVMTMTGTFQTTTHLGSNPNSASTIISDKVVGMVIDTAAGTTTATTYNCVEGSFLGGVGANGCLNTSTGGNFANESSAAYNVGANANCVVRTLGGDDSSTGNPRGLSTLAAGGGCDATDGAFNMYTVSQSGGLLILSTSTPVGTSGANYLTFVPVPAAVWLFGSALGLLGWVRRRAQA